MGENLTFLRLTDQGSLYPGFRDAGASSVDNLETGDFDVMTDTEVVAAGQDLGRGAVLGRVAATRELVLSAAAAGDGSETPSFILLHPTDTTDGTARKAPVALTGGFNVRALVWGAGHTAQTVKDALRPFCIFVRNTVKG